MKEGVFLDSRENAVHYRMENAGDPSEEPSHHQQRDAEGHNQKDA